MAEGGGIGIGHFGVEVAFAGEITVFACEETKRKSARCYNSRV